MYGDGGLSDVIPADMNSMLHSSDGDFQIMKEYANYNEHNHHHHQNRTHNHQRSESSSLTRYRSAPSSFFANLLEENGFDDLLAPPVAISLNPDQQAQQNFQSDSREVSGIQKADLSPESRGMYGSSLQMPEYGRRKFSGIGDHINADDLKRPATFRSMDSKSSNLIRQSSSPAGFLSSLNSQSDIGLKNNINFVSGLSSSSKFSHQVVENMNQMNDSTFKSLKRSRDGDSIALEKQNGLSGHYSSGLVHHLSLPKTSSEMAVAEKLLRFEQHSMATNSRAKRGCATHPRSIAERVRRTRISNRMKKLQDLFPDMDKQTSIADMLDSAVKHIKDLQKDLQTLKDARSSCTCSNKQ